jgi:superfamily II DNA or RNA helicase
MDGRLMDPDEALRTAKDRIARALLGEGTVERRIGQLTLRPHQATAVERLLAILATHRGALLADAVGLGKTYVALAVAREHRSALVICPASLRGMWDRAMAASGLTLPIVSVESLSRGVKCPPADLLIIDEAHHLRTPGTRRYEAVAHLARRARVLLMSATPLQNARGDLTAMLALFAGSTVSAWNEAAIARLIVRRDEKTADQRLPELSGPHALSPGADDDCLDAILALPPAIPASDEGVAAALAAISLVHLWASSRGALVASARKRLARATALRDVVASGHVPTAAELSAWHFADDSLQLAFPLFAAPAPPTNAESLQAQLDAFIDGAQALIDRCRQAPDPDEARVMLLRTLRDRHRGERVVAFSQYANTIGTLGRLMRADAGLALVTADGARIASGPVRRDEVLAQFAGDAAPAPRVERIDLLLTTDLLSEGIDLRGASVIVHLDLPWNPARMEQRVGRARRLGSAFETIHVYTFVPPTAAERMLELRRRLTEKVKVARATIGPGFDPFEVEVSESAVARGEKLRAHLRSWIEPSSIAPAELAVASARANERGWIAVVRLDGAMLMISDFGSGIDDDASRLLQIADGIGAACAIDEPRHDAAVRQIRDWLAARHASAGSGLQPPAKRAVLDRLTQTVARAPRHRRASVVAMAQRTRASLAVAAGIGAERVMATLATSTADDEAWLQSVDAFGSLHRKDCVHGEARGEILALILLEPVSQAGDATPG